MPEQTNYVASLDAAEHVALAVAEGADYDAEVRNKLCTLQRRPGWTVTDHMRFSVLAQDKVFQLLRLYKAGYERLGGGAPATLEIKPIGGPDA